MLPEKSLGQFIKAPKIKKYPKVKSSSPDIDVIHESSSDSSGHGTISYGNILQEHARPRPKVPTCSGSQMSTMEMTTTRSNMSISSSITKFRNDFDQLKCKMRIFGETLNLCRCIADDFRTKLVYMEKRLDNLEKRQRLSRNASNYSAIIQKNKMLSYRTLKDAKLREYLALCPNYYGHGKKSEQAISLEESITAGEERFSSGDHEPEDAALAGLPPGGPTILSELLQPLGGNDKFVVHCGVLRGRPLFHSGRLPAKN